ncbi:MAG: M50 family metallopeptidase [Chthoniobacterales bacterium]
MRTGAIRLFRIAGITVYLHFTWFIVAAFFISGYTASYQSPVWGVLEYLTVFLIVLVHEFGHALACRQVGGIADRIILWPLGGIAFVNPPRRAGAYLWSIAAGPLVNVMLVPVLFLASRLAYASASRDLVVFFHQLSFLNLWILIFNLLPIFPLDGGQIVRGLLWFPFGEIRSLQISSALGLVGGALLALWGLSRGSMWLAVLAFFLLSRAWYGWQQAKLMVAAADHGVAVSPSPTAGVEEPRR